MFNSATNPHAAARKLEAEYRRQDQNCKNCTYSRPSGKQWWCPIVVDRVAVGGICKHFSPQKKRLSLKDYSSAEQNSNSSGIGCSQE